MPATIKQYKSSKFLEMLMALRNRGLKGLFRHLKETIQDVKSHSGFVSQVQVLPEAYIILFLKYFLF